jgi:hypothetical protein
VKGEVVMRESNYKKVVAFLPKWRPESKPGMSRRSQQFSTVDIVQIAKCGFLEARAIKSKLQQDGLIPR